MLHLSKKWAAILLAQPETGMGYQVASIILRNGRRFDRVTIVGAAITELGGSRDVPFTEEEIADIIVTKDQ